MSHDNKPFIKILSNQSTLKKFKSEKNKKKLLFFPGGPGIESDYLQQLSHKIKNFELWFFDYPRSQFKDKNFERWIADAEEAISYLDDVIPIGHSFGGFLLMMIQNLPTMVSDCVLLDSCPSYDAFVGAHDVEVVV